MGVAAGRGLLCAASAGKCESPVGGRPACLRHNSPLQLRRRHLLARPRRLGHALLLSLLLAPSLLPAAPRRNGLLLLLRWRVGVVAHALCCRPRRLVLVLLAMVVRASHHEQLCSYGQLCRRQLHIQVAALHGSQGGKGGRGMQAGRVSA
jgi:hypothetical protein